MKRFIKLTLLDSYIKEEALDKIDNKSAVDEHGRTKEWYEDMSIPVPEFFKNPKPSQLSKDDYETERSVVRLIPDMIDFMVDSADGGCRIYYSGATLDVEEDSEQVEAVIADFDNYNK